MSNAFYSNTIVPILHIPPYPTVHTYPTTPKIKNERTRKPSARNAHQHVSLHCHAVSSSTILSIASLTSTSTGSLFFCSSLCFFRFIIVSSFHLFMFPRPLSDLLMFQLSHPTHVIPSQSILDLIKHSPMVAFLSFDPRFSFSPSSEKSVLHSGPSLSFVPSDHFASVLSLLK